MINSEMMKNLKLKLMINTITEYNLKINKGDIIYFNK